MEAPVGAKLTGLAVRRAILAMWGDLPVALDTPVLFLIFNRPEPTLRVFDAIRKVEPKYLFVAADGPRSDRPGDADLCKRTRAILQQVDWDCDLRVLLRDENLGVKHGVASAINWFFGEVPEGIILEDDCLPEPTFFQFCSELLQRYREDDRVGAICGDHFGGLRSNYPYSYYFSRYNLIWGWASWRRAWRLYDIDMKLWPEIRDCGWLDQMFADRRTVNFWTKRLNAVYTNATSTWDYQWMFALWINSGLTIMPRVNQIKNIGFGIDATHTTKENSFSNRPTFAMSLPLKHPSFTIRDSGVDRAIDREYYSIVPPYGRVVRKVRRALAKVQGWR